MTPQRQRIAIAEFCGWAFDHIQKGAMYYVPIIDAHVGNPVNDRNAMAEAKAKLWETDWNARNVFLSHLANIVKGRIVNHNEWDAETLLDATCQQEAEAFLRTIEKWEVDP